MIGSRRIVACMAWVVFAVSAGAQNWELLEATGTMTPRSDAGFMSCKGRFYLMGGYGIRPIDIYDPGTGTWSQGTPPPVEMHHFQAERLGEEIWVMGAFTGTGAGERPLEHIYVYHTERDEWRRGDAILEHRRRGSAGVVAYKGVFYMVGGTRDRNTGSHTPWIDRYDPKTGEWKELRDAPRSRDHFHAAVINGKIYAAGGRNTTWYSGIMHDRTIPEIDAYDIRTNRWNTLPPEQNLPTPRAGCTAVAYLDNLLVIGGESMSRDSAFDRVEVLDVETGQWSRWGKLNSPRRGTQALMCVGRIFIASGSPGRNPGGELASIEQLIF